VAQGASTFSKVEAGIAVPDFSFRASEQTLWETVETTLYEESLELVCFFQLYFGKPAAKGTPVGAACAGREEKFMVKLTGFWCIPLLHEIFMVVSSHDLKILRYVPRMSQSKERAGGNQSRINIWLQGCPLPPLTRESRLLLLLSLLPWDARASFKRKQVFFLRKKKKKT